MIKILSETRKLSPQRAVYRSASTLPEAGDPSTLGRYSGAFNAGKRALHFPAMVSYLMDQKEPSEEVKSRLVWRLYLACFHGDGTGWEVEKWRAAQELSDPLMTSPPEDVSTLADERFAVSGSRKKSQKTVAVISFLE